MLKHKKELLVIAIFLFLILMTPREYKSPVIGFAIGFSITRLVTKKRYK